MINYTISAGMPGDDSDSQTVFVVTADYGLNGHEVLGVFHGTTPPDTSALAKARGCESVVGFSGIEVNVMAVEAS